VGQERRTNIFKSKIISNFISNNAALFYLSNLSKQTFVKKITVLFLFCSWFAFAHCQSPITRLDSTKSYFQQSLNYKIDVTLNDVDNTLDGFEIINYTNHSPDTLQYIWFHLWPNAYKNDRTAFSEQLLLNNRVDFYFSNNEQRGYINRLDFKVDGVTATLEDHPLYIDVARLILPVPLIPGQTIKITTPFHEKIPFNFSRGGYVGHTYQATQWYPKPAVYDYNGWHPMPYLDQGEFYSEFGDFSVQITLPRDYVVAATGQLQNPEEKDWLLARQDNMAQPDDAIKKTIIKPKVPKSLPQHQAPKKTIHPLKKGKEQEVLTKDKDMVPATPPWQTPIKIYRETKTLNYRQDSVHDFAWFADKHFLVRHDTLALPSGKVITAWSFFTPAGYPVWKNSIQFIKDAVITRSAWLGEYPYDIVSAVEAKMGFNGGMEYPTITSISPMVSAKELDLTIEHEVGHNWNYGILASNERDHPWMDEGMNTYFDNRYEAMKYPAVKQAPVKKDPLNINIPQVSTDLGYRIQLSSKKDQPIETSSEYFSETNYDVIAYYKTGRWMKLLENYVGQPLFDSCLHEYYSRWKYKHPSPGDFKDVVAQVSNKNVDSIFAMLSQRGPIDPMIKKDTKLYPLFTVKNTDKHHYIFIAPSLGYNYYDKLMIGGILHNYTLPEPAFHFFLAPMYATASKTFAGIANAGYSFLSYGLIRKAELSLSAEKFSVDEYTDSTGTKNYLGFSKIVPAIKIIFRNKDATSSLTKSVQWKTYFIEETGVLFTRDTVNQVDVISYPKIDRYLNQLRLNLENNRVLYPYSGTLQAEQANDFVRLALEGNYFFNYAKGGGLQARLFGGKFIYLGDKTLEKQFETDRYHLNMTGADGFEDYTYSNYFAGRNEFQGFRSQQIMIRDGGFKVRSDLLANKIGKTDDWLAAANLTTDFPKSFNPLQVLPVKIPLKVFLDVGTYAEAWKKDAATGKFIYDAGLQLSIVKNLVNIYVPILYSKVYSDYFKSTITEKRFWKNISFSIDIQNFRLSKFFSEPAL
jgi:Peptidase family M1 domain